MNLKDYLQINSISLRSFARTLECDYGALSHISRGLRTCSPTLAQAIEEATGGEVKAADLIRKKEPKKCPHCHEIIR